MLTGAYRERCGSRHHEAVSVSAAMVEAFFSELTVAGSVWAVRDAEGYPAPVNDDGVRVMPFWSKRSRAEKVVLGVPAFAGFDVVELTVAEWRDRWLPGLQADGLLVGLNWSGPRATGYDLTPAEVAERMSLLS